MFCDINCESQHGTCLIFTKFIINKQRPKYLLVNFNVPKIEDFVILISYCWKGFHILYAMQNVSSCLISKLYFNIKKKKLSQYFIKFCMSE